MAYLNIDDLPVAANYLFGENDKEKHKGVNRFNKALWSKDERIDELAQILLDTYQQENTIRYFKKDKPAYFNAFKVYLANIAVAYKSKKNYIAVSLNNNDFTCDIKEYKPTKITRTVFNKINNWLANKDYINFYKSKASLKSEIQSIIEPLGGIKRIIDDYEIKFHEIFYHEDYSFVQMKDDNEKLVVFEDDEYTLKRKEILRKYNEYLTTQDITVYENPISKPVGLRAEFKHNNKESYGRINGGAWMQTKKDTRLDDIRIDEEEVVEVDLSSSTIRIASDLEGNHLPLDFDAYHIEGIDRELVKTISTRLQNTGPCSVKQGCSRVTSSIFNEYVQEATKNIGWHELSEGGNSEDIRRAKGKQKQYLSANSKNKEVMNRNKIPYTLDELRINVDAVYDFQSKFAGSWLCQGRGLELMYIESKVCFKIIEKFLELNKVVLTNQDGFIAKKQDLNILKEVVVSSYLEVVGSEPKITIK